MLSVEGPQVRRSPRWAGSRRTTTSRTASCRGRSCRRSCGASRSCRRSTACGSATSSTPGDGNLHPLVLYDAEAGETEQARELAEAILEPCLDAGGSLTGEHGVGMDKACSMPRMFSERDLAVFDRLRRAFDPRVSQPRQGHPDTAAVRRGTRAVPRACTREDRPCRASLASRRPPRPRCAQRRDADGTNRRRPDDRWPRPRPGARGRRPHVHGRVGPPAVGAERRPRPRTASGSRSTRPATRPSAPSSPRTLRGHCATASARPATSCSA